MRPLPGQRGAALVVVMIIVVALLTAGALALYLQMGDTHSAQYSTGRRGAMACAESGLAGSRAFIENHASSWDAMLDSSTSNDPTGYPVQGDLDGDGTMDWEVTVRDDDDEFPTDDPDNDSNNTIWIVARCLEYDDSPREVLEMISMSGGGTHYRDQAGQGATGSNNRN